MFNPSRDDVRRFFCELWRKHREAALLTPLEAMALERVLEHPEYHAELADPDAAAARNYNVDEGRENPFLHLAMHLAIDEQLSIDQPPGIRAAFQRLAARRASAHEAAHEVMECLGRMLWEAQRAATPLGFEELSGRYIECVRARASRH